MENITFILDFTKIIATNLTVLTDSYDLTFGYCFGEIGSYKFYYKSENFAKKNGKLSRIYFSLVCRIISLAVNRRQY